MVSLFAGFEGAEPRSGYEFVGSSFAFRQRTKRVRVAEPVLPDLVGKLGESVSSNALRGSILRFLKGS
jgi:hypothetical protein